MIDILLLAGVALCILSVLLAILALARTQAPRGAAISLVLGLLVLLATNALDDRPLSLNSVAQSWFRVTSGQLSPTTSTDAPAADAPAASAPTTGQSSQ
ncbi:hypothetical protein RM190_01935 [Paracoccus sp. CPCC 101403]|uniref:Uncharacterized protein n=1 Tax=Paracoccus broussonetiae TaxID=3075834 RepID=A0ABU3E8Q4_9RHOB|nr:hypothetical protein [Paracoccus sp. CPCC 101403]MDT1060597.1 hypothetical protein [Paracoccus sp. CPCC 101403]